jgi:WD40 repeat protein
MNYSKVKVIAINELFVLLSFTLNRPVAADSQHNPLWTFNCNPQAILSLDISANGSYIVAGTGYHTSPFNGNAYLFSNESPTPVWSVPVDAEVRSVAISADGQYFGVGSYVGVDLYSTHSSTPEPISDQDIACVDISANGSYLVASGSNISIYYRDTGYWIGTYLKPAWKVVLSADGRFFQPTWAPLELHLRESGLGGLHFRRRAVHRGGQLFQILLFQPHQSRSPVDLCIGRRQWLHSVRHVSRWALYSRRGLQVCVSIPI